MDEDLEARKLRDPVAPSKRFKAAVAKIQGRVLTDDTNVHSFQTLLKDLSGIVRSTCRCKDNSGSAITFEVVTQLSDQRRRALNL